jgi:transposase
MPREVLDPAASTAVDEQIFEGEYNARLNETLTLGDNNYNQYQRGRGRMRATSPSEGVAHIAMETTGVYWKPVWHILSDGEFELTLANAAHVRNAPGRKTDVNDATKPIRRR